jgi:hypothetical protein
MVCKAATASGNAASTEASIRGTHFGAAIAVSTLSVAAKDARQLQDGLQAGGLAQMMLCCRSAEGGDVAGNQTVVHLHLVLQSALDGQSHFQVAAQDGGLQLTAQLHLQRLGTGRHAHV